MKKFDTQFAIEILKYALWFGMITGLVEGMLLYALQRYELLRGQITYLGSGPQVLWVAPVFDALFFLLVGVGAAVVAQFLPRKFARPAVFFVFCFLASFGWLLVYLSGRLNPAATAILGAGIGYQVSTVIVARENRFARFAQRTFKILAGVTLALFVLVQGGLWVRERVAASNLPQTQGSEPTPNILLIVMDTVRADHLSLQGYERETDPTLKRIASEGVMFENAYAASSWTLTSHASLFTGRWPYEHKADGGRYLDETYPTIAEALTERGYRTGAFNGNFETVTSHWGFARGFLHFEDYYQTLPQLAVSSVYGRFMEYYVFHKVFNMEFSIDRRWGPSVNQSALDWIDQDDDTPFFAFVNYYDAHAPYISPERAKFSNLPNPGGLVNTDWTTADIYNSKTPEQAQGEIDAYDGGIYYTDQQIDVLLKELESRGKLDNTIVVITSDHGELFGEHGLWEHHNSLYKPVIYVPLIVWYPKSAPQNMRIDTPVSNTFIPAMLLDMLGEPEQTAFRGPPLSQLWADPAAAADFPDPIAEMAESSWVNPHHLSIRGDMVTVLSPEWQFIAHEFNGIELYNLNDDPDQENNLAGENPAEVDSLTKYYLDLLAQLGMTWPYDNK
ncbi:MAG: sulfatase-like hydrolase/transferase [Anaerolineae bacterium]|nr:sulfatase-like hydrolase/transferase [Anaerolineae bacterium]MBL8105432.1 sulfatase-like hydrolase/transferase [Anaerolineales bacterium]MCC7187636.1 sulfatase-like hydrolase/transferase [Anaerolineales bacterium]